MRIASNKMIHAFSIDLEDWFHGIELPTDEWGKKEYRLEKGLDTVLSLLHEQNVQCTFFCLGWIGEKKPKVIKLISDAGHEIAAHGYCHDKVYDLSKKQFADDIKKTKDILETVTGKKVSGYRAPYFSITSRCLWALEELKKAGFVYDCSISPVKTWRYGISSSPDYIYKIKEVDLIEFPVSIFKFLNRKFGAGGAYFRIFPYIFFKTLLKQKGAKGKPCMFYAHPWEFDPEHPVVSFDWKAKITHYYNLKSMQAKTKKLLTDFRFTSVSNIIEQLEIEKKIEEISISRLESY